MKLVTLLRLAQEHPQVIYKGHKDAGFEPVLHDPWFTKSS